MDGFTDEEVALVRMAARELRNTFLDRAYASKGDGTDNHSYYMEMADILTAAISKMPKEDKA